MKNTILSLVFILTIALSAEAIKIIDKPIKFGSERVEMTKAYIHKHYGKKVKSIKIIPKIIVLHWTGGNSFSGAFNTFKPQKLRGRKDIAKASALNVSSHYMVDRGGEIYKLMPDNWMARHVIGLNYSSIGIENIGGARNKEDLTEAQLKANIALVKHLKKKYPSIEYLIGHYEYKKMEKTKLWLEKDKGYRTSKSDPGPKFTKSVRRSVKPLHLKGVPK